MRTARKALTFLGAVALGLVLVLGHGPTKDGKDWERPYAVGQQ